ncbi:hypothetical protein FB382_000793 [Nocardioides ginsengisegetis]|uniref:SnoaL-like domain-containing protein n=1 Tax=Nocardioides ginsengisegetis TaxID=661491 RepID=A0A7W3IXK2_9ACTN|nr:hypothetical protein [Nocardioides ginsengisegetis]
MMTTSTMPSPAAIRTSVDKFVAFLESGGEAPEGLFAPTVFGDLTFPHWRVQTDGADELIAGRRRLHPQPGRVRLERVTPTETGYLVKLEERWEDGGQEWYCREGFVMDLDESGAVCDFTLYCTGDWDEARQREHANTVTLLRP